MKYKLCFKPAVRYVYSSETDSLDEALAHFDKPFGAVRAEDKFYEIKEELENAESIRSKPGTGFNSETAGVGEISEDTGGELSEPDWDNPE